MKNIKDLDSYIEGVRNGLDIREGHTYSLFGMEIEEVFKALTQYKENNKINVINIYHDDKIKLEFDEYTQMYKLYHNGNCYNFKK